MTDTTPAQRIAAYLDARRQLADHGAPLTGQIAEAKNAGQPWARLTAPDLRVVLDELDCAKSSSDRAATAWHDVVAERDQARQIARKLRSYLDIWVDATLIPGLEQDLTKRLGLDALPDWLTTADHRSDGGHET